MLEDIHVPTLMFANRNEPPPPHVRNTLWSATSNDAHLRHWVGGARKLLIGIILKVIFFQTGTLITLTSCDMESVNYEPFFTCSNSSLESSLALRIAYSSDPLICHSSTKRSTKLMAHKPGFPHSQVLLTVHT